MGAYVRLLILSCFTAAALAASVRPADACSCAGGPGLTPDALKGAAAVFTARVDAIHRPASIVTALRGGGVAVSMPSAPVEIDLSIEELFTGVVAGNPLLFKTAIRAPSTSRPAAITSFTLFEIRVARLRLPNARARAHSLTPLRT